MRYAYQYIRLEANIELISLQPAIGYIVVILIVSTPNAGDLFAVFAL